MKALPVPAERQGFVAFFMEAYMTLERFFAAHPKVALGFSGGVDSSYLLYAAQRYGADVKPYFIKTVFQPQFELKDAARLAEQLGVHLEVLSADILQTAEVARNGARRCYHCKRELFDRLRAAALADGYGVLLDGSNASDDAGDRPGMQALEELEVLSPLRLCGITKTEVRRLSREAGLFTWNKPAYACLATRVPAGTAITEEDLSRVEKAEEFLFSLGFSDFRGRLMGENTRAARVQLPESQMQSALHAREKIIAGLSGFSAVLLDLAPRPQEK